MKNKRRNHGAQFKAKVALIAEIIASTVKPTTENRPWYNIRPLTATSDNFSSYTITTPCRI